MSIVFFGSSDFSLAALEACLASPHRIKMVITTPDRPQGRGLQNLPTPVKKFALEASLPVISPENLKDEALIESVRALEPDFFVVSSYGKIIPSAWLKIPKELSLNVHPSLIPLYRGAAPVNWPILNGDKETGISIIEVAPKLDAGDIFYQKHVPIEPDIDSDVLTQQLAQLSKVALGDVWLAHAKGAVTRIKQDEKHATYARKLAKEDGKIDWSKSAEEISRQVRGTKPWPLASTTLKGENLQILKAIPEAGKGAPGAFAEAAKDGFSVYAGKGKLKVLSVKPAGKKEMPAADYARGKRLAEGTQFGS